MQGALGRFVVAPGDLRRHGDVGEQNRHLALSDLVLASRFADTQVRATTSGAASRFRT
jgi:hypothetical protein